MNEKLLSAYLAWVYAPRGSSHKQRDDAWETYVKVRDEGLPKREQKPVEPEKEENDVFTKLAARRIYVQ
jgi:hypothetical protein